MQQKYFAPLVLGVFFITNTAIGTVPTAPENGVEISLGQQQLNSVLELHRKAVPYDSTNQYTNKTKTYRGHIAALKMQRENEPIVNLHRDAIDIFKKSSWLATTFEPEHEPVCVGTQLLQDLEIIAGQMGSEASCRLFSLIPPASASSFGKVSAALLLAAPQSNRDVLVQRQDVLRYLSDDAQSDVYVRLSGLYKAIATEERYMLPLLKSPSLYDNSFFSSGSLILSIPGLNKLKTSPLVRTVDDWWGLVESMSWTAFLGLAAWRIGMYGVHALRLQKTGALVDGEWGLPDHTGRNMAENNGDFYMPFDIKMLWKAFPKDPNAQGVFSLSTSALLFFILFKYRLNYFRGLFLEKQYDWYSLSRAAEGFSAVREIYELIKGNSVLRALPDCASVYNFFEVQVPQDQLLKELMDLLDSFPLDKEVGSSMWLGYTSRANELLGKKIIELCDLMIGVGRIEAYLCFAKLLKNTDFSTLKNQYCFPEYVDDAAPVTFHAEQLWNPVLSPAVVVPSDIYLGGSALVRNYLLTGPNAGGKSTILKGCGIAALLAQTVGIVPAKSCKTSIFAVLETYLNITDDAAQGNSLFKKEVMRATDLLKRAAAVGNKPVFFIFDEMFSGTAPHEGISAAAGVCRNIAEKSNIISCIATHYRYLTKLSDVYPSIQNKCVRLAYDEQLKKYMRTYQLYNGVSDQHVALDMLKEEGVDFKIIEYAYDVLRDIEKNGIGT